jgi:hypothetical protein
VDQPTEHLATSYPGRRQLGDLGGAVATIRWQQVSGPVRAMPVIVLDVLIQDL